MDSYTKNKNLTVINMLGGPGSGKSTVAAGLFSLMKCHNYNVELVTEYPKDLIWAERQNMFTEQDYILAKQNHRLRCLVGKVDYVVTDTSLLLGLFYMPDDFPSSFAPFVLDTFNSYNNINIFLKRLKPYVQLGRNESEAESNSITLNILNKLEQLDMPYYSFNADEMAHLRILEFIKNAV